MYGEFNLANSKSRSNQKSSLAKKYSVEFNDFAAPKTVFQLYTLLYVNRFVGRLGKIFKAYGKSRMAIG